MRYIVIIGDGMGDRPIEKLGNKTPLDVAKKPYIDRLANCGNVGITQTLTNDLPLGSDVANLAVLGYKPLDFYTGRSPIEALGLGLDVGDNDMVFRCNLVNIEESTSFSDSVMIDHSSDKITDAEGRLIVDFLNEQFENDDIKFYFGASYRNIMVWKNFFEGDNIPKLDLTAPHDILTQKIGEHLPKGKNADKLLDMMKKSVEIFRNHPVNIKRREKGLRDANCAWFWGEGTKPHLTSFFGRHHLKGAMITAVPLLSGIANGIGLDNIKVENATGDIHTNFEGKANACLKAIDDGYEFVFVHMEAPDECGHDGNAEEKVLSIEYIDQRCVKIIVDGLKERQLDYKILLMPDHATPIALRTHTVDDIPFLIFDSTKQGVHSASSFNETGARKTGLVIKNGYDIMRTFIQ